MTVCIRNPSTAVMGSHPSLRSLEAEGNLASFKGLTSGRLHPLVNVNTEEYMGGSDGTQWICGKKIKTQLKVGWAKQWRWI